MNPRLLILTQYFPPEVGAPQNRLFELAVRLQERGIDVTVLTAMPNYPEMKIHEAYLGKSYVYEEMQGLKIHRSRIYVPKSKSFLRRLLNYFSFVYTSAYCGTFKVKGNFDFLLCESPPLFLGLSALWLKNRKKSKMIFNVSDLWPETAEKLGLVSNKLLLGLSYKLEAYLYKRSVLVTGQTQGICKNISARFPNKRTYWLPNGVDVSYYDVNLIKSNWRVENKFSDQDFILLYAGIIGYAQGLEVILDAAERTKAFTHIKYILLGSGPEKERLLSLKEEKKLANVHFINGVGKDKMPFIVSAIDVALIPLKRLDIFKGAIPSKIFENLAMKKPLLLGVEGEAKELFIDEGKCGVAYEPENAADLAEKVLYLDNNRALMEEMGARALSYVKEKFNRDTIAGKFYDIINGLHTSSR
ncbi:MAG: glycosyltransferase family 4 protein [Bacteroidia bacterium]